GDPRGQRQQPGQWPGQVRGGALHQYPALHRAFVSDTELERGQVSQAAVHQLAGPPRGAEGDVVGVDGQDRQPAGCGIERDPGTRRSQAYDDELDLVGGTGQSGVDRRAHGARYLPTRSASCAARSVSLTPLSAIVVLDSVNPWAVSMTVRA